MNQPIEIEVEKIDHLGVLAPIVDEIGIVEIINRLLATHPLGKFLTIQDFRGQNCRAPCIVLIPKIWMGGSFDPKIIGLHPRSSIRLSGMV